MPADSPPPAQQDEVPLDVLWTRYKSNADVESRQELVRRHQPLVRYLAEHQAAKLPRSVDVDDLMQEGNFGLMDAIEKFDPSRGVKFKTYCGTRVRGAMLDSLRSQDWVPRLARQRAALVEKTTARLHEELGRAPEEAELANALDLPVTAVRDASPRAMHSISDRRQQQTEGFDQQLDGLAEATHGDPVDFAHRTDLVEALTKSLNAKEKGILHMYYLEGLTLREIGMRLSITESRVCQIHSNVIKRLRQRLEGDREQFQA
jgi:RNA polymerase sigma factor for flagellar operon FliA